VGCDIFTYKTPCSNMQGLEWFPLNNVRGLAQPRTCLIHCAERPRPLQLVWDEH
jgi:hypothetical protein